MNTKSKNQQEEVTGFLANPMVGTVLTVASGVCFLSLGMILPLVGRAGAMTPYYGKNRLTFLLVALLTLVLAVLAVLSKLTRRKIDHSPLPVFSLLLSGLTLFLLLAFLAGLLAI